MGSVDSPAGTERINTRLTLTQFDHLTQDCIHMTDLSYNKEIRVSQAPGDLLHTPEVCLYRADCTDRQANRSADQQDFM